MGVQEVQSENMEYHKHFCQNLGRSGSLVMKPEKLVERYQILDFECSKSERGKRGISPRLSYLGSRGSDRLIDDPLVLPLDGLGISLGMKLRSLTFVQHFLLLAYQYPRFH